MNKEQGKKQFYYGMAVLLLAFVVTGLSVALRDGKEQEAFDEKTKKESSKEDVSQEAEVNNPDIRVLIMTDGYRGEVHTEVRISSQEGMDITAGEEKEVIEGPQEVAFAPDDGRFSNGRIRLSGKNGTLQINSFSRACKTPSYEGVIELISTAEGIVVINELPVEQYLCRVVPSEMPSSYEPEALKAQAVCARSYAYRQMESYGYPEYEAHVNDSTDYQVYGNSNPQETCSKAVQDTGGQVVRYQDQIVTTYYYSTSCGRTTTLEAWGTVPDGSAAYLQSVEVKGEQGDYEKDLPWYRWEAVIPVETLSRLVGLNTGTDVGTIESIALSGKGPGDVVTKMDVTGNKGTVTVETENKIRSALGGSGYQIKKQDGSMVNSTRLLPSAFFTIEKAGNQFVIHGGGHGHGIGMSQNGANEMAKQGKNYKEILGLFYPGVSVGP